MPGETLLRHVSSLDTEDDAGFDLAEFPAVTAWLRRVEQQPRFMNDLAPYPANARPGASVSVYDG